MMQSADLREGDNLASGGRVCGTGVRTVLVEREMRSGPMIVLNVGRQDASQMTLVDDDDVIKAFAADRANDALDLGVLPG